MLHDREPITAIIAIRALEFGIRIRKRLKVGPSSFGVATLEDDNEHEHEDDSFSALFTISRRSRSFPAFPLVPYPACTRKI